jgi:hypothetical protein
MTVTGINIEEKVRNYQGTSNFIKALKPGLMKWGRLTQRQYQAAEKVIMNEERQKEINIEELPERLKSIVTYTGESTFVNDLKMKFKKYRKLTDKQVDAGFKAIDREIQKDSQKEMNIKLVGNTIKIGRKVAMGIKENYNLEFHPILVDVTEVMVMSNKAFKLKAKLTKENGGICRCCGRTLTDEMSQVTGIGPVCAKYVGVEHPKSKDDVEQFKVDISNKIDEIGEFEFWIPKRAIVEWNGTAGVMMRW